MPEAVQIPLGIDRDKAWALSGCPEDRRAAVAVSVGTRYRCGAWSIVARTPSRMVSASGPAI